MKFIEEKRSFSDRFLLVLFLSFGIFIGYIFLGIFTDIRVGKLRPFITKHAVEEGVIAGIEVYKKQLEIDEPLLSKKRKAKDEALKRYINKMEEIINE